jgi:ParB-like chromosome segregation protein Spo0J
MDLANIKDVRPPKWTSSCYVVSPDYKKLEKSIKKYGILSPIVIQPDGTIVDGFHRWKVANELGLPKVPVVVVQVDDIEAMLLHIDLNRYRGIVIAKYLSNMIRRILQSGRYDHESLRSKMGLTSEEFDVLAEGSLVKMRKIKQHTYSPAWVPIESATGEDIKVERVTGHAEQV